MSTPKLGGIKDRLYLLYAAQLKQRSDVLRELFARLQAKTATVEDFELLELEAHKLAGSAASYGFGGISSAAAPLDVRLRRGERDTDNLADLVRILLQTIEAVLDPSASKEVIEEAPQFQALRESAVGRGRKYRPSILIADDDSAVQALLVELLSEFAVVHVADTGGKALEALRTLRFDLVLLDHKLPDMDGFAVISAMKASERSAKTTVMMLTAVRDGVAVARLLLAGASDYVVKPFHPDSLVRRVRIALRNRPRSVLIADDDRLIREVFRVKFLDRGINVHFASNGIEALAMARLERPNLVLLDVGMPRMDGLSVLDALKDDPATQDIPTVMLSGRASEQDIAKGLERGAELYIPKPFLPDDVVNRCACFLFPAAEAA